MVLNSALNTQQCTRIKLPLSILLPLIRLSTSRALFYEQLSPTDEISSDNMKLYSTDSTVRVLRAATVGCHKSRYQPAAAMTSLITGEAPPGRLPTLTFAHPRHITISVGYSMYAQYSK